MFNISLVSPANLASTGELRLYFSRPQGQWLSQKWHLLLCESCSHVPDHDHIQWKWREEGWYWQQSHHLWDLAMLRDGCVLYVVMPVVGKKKHIFSNQERCRRQLWSWVLRMNLSKLLTCLIQAKPTCALDTFHSHGWTVPAFPSAWYWISPS